MSLTSAIWSLFSIKHYCCVLLKNGIVVDKIYQRVRQTTFLLYKINKKHVAYIIPSMKDIIIEKHCLTFYADIENSVAYSISSNSNEEINNYHAKINKRQTTKFGKYIVSPLMGDERISHLGVSRAVGIGYLPSSLIGKWLSGETLDLLMEAPKEKSMFGDKLWLYIIGGVVAIMFVYFVFGR